MSHYLNDADKMKFANATNRALKPGGFVSIMHFSENDEVNKGLGRSLEFLKSMYPGMEAAVDWREVKWRDPNTNKEHSAWTAILRKPGGKEIETRPKERKIFRELSRYISTLHYDNQESLKAGIREFGEMNARKDDPKTEEYINKIANYIWENKGEIKEEDFIEKSLEFTKK